MALNYDSANYSGTEGGDKSISYHMYCYLGYGTVTRTGNTVSIPIGLKFEPWGSDDFKWCKNSVGGYFPGNKENVRYAFNNKDAVEAYAKRGEILYCTTRSLSTSGGKNTTDEAAWTYTGTVTANQTSVTVTVYATWSQYDLGAVNGQYHDAIAVSRSIPIPAATAPSGTVSIGSVSRTSASYSVSASAGNYTTISSYEWSISPSATISNKTSSSGSFTDLQPNTDYTASCVVKNSAGLTTTIRKSFTTTGNAPDITDINVIRERTSLTLDVSVDYDTNDSFSYYIIEYAPIDGSATTISQTSPTITGLRPNTVYALGVKVVGSKGRVSDEFGWVGRTTCNLPSNLWMSCTGYNHTSITVQVGATGDTNAPITGYTVYWVGPDGIEYGTSISSNTFTVNNLLVDTNYDFYFMAHNYAGGVASEAYTYSTTLTSPTFNSLYVADVTPFSLTIGVDVEIEPRRQLLYAFSKDDGNSWTPYQEANSYHWTDLTEETTYDFAIRARALHESLYAQDSYITMSYRHTTPADQASVRVKTADGWKKGKAWLKCGDEWKKAKKIYIKNNGWHIGTNKD